MDNNKQYLFEKYNALELSERSYNYTGTSTSIPTSITNNIAHMLRPYQQKAIQRFISYHTNYKHRDTNKHLLFEMATGTGKTLVMACIMLYLYEKGYRNFLFFVNSTNIIEKTKQNFTAQGTSKYLFADKIEINNEIVTIRSIDVLTEANDSCMNILFTTIQGLHTSLQNPRENSFTLEDFKEHKIVLLSDESHHTNTSTKKEIELLCSWEKSILNIWQQHKDNHLLEFTATAELNNSSIKEKYLNKAIIQYGLKEFRQDGYSKNIFLAQTKTDEIKERFLLAILLSQYRLEIASKYGLNIKPVILFKSKTIAESKNYTKKFNEIIEHIKEKDVRELFLILKKYKHIDIYKNVYNFFIDGVFSHNYIASRIKLSFSQDKIVNVNKDEDVKNMQVILNTLEDYNNKYRVIFAVNKLNEGWDVLNLYDIVKLYETPSVAKKPPTAQEIQLIGRGARLFPYCLNDYQERFKRKYDNDIDNELVILEQLHFHTSDGSKYIEQLNKDLEEAGLINSDLQEEKITLKEDFRKSEIYKNKYIYINTRVKREKEHMFQKDLFGGISDIKKDERFNNLEGKYKVKINLDNIEMYENMKIKRFEYKKEVSLKLKNIPNHVFIKAIAKNKYFTFDTIAKLLDIKSILELKEKFSNNRLYILHPQEYQKKDIVNSYNLMKVCSNFLNNLKQLLNDVYTEYIGTQELKQKLLKEIFKDKKIIVHKDNLVDGNTFKYFAQDKFRKGTTYEQQLIQDICSFFEQRNEKIAWLIRNERDFQIYNFEDGKAFEPDFLLMLQKDKKKIYQIFIEPKGEHLQGTELWKEDLMKKIATLSHGDLDYKIIALPFYNPTDRNNFYDILEKKISQ